MKKDKDKNLIILLLSLIIIYMVFKYIIPRIEYSCAVTPQVRQTGNRLSGLAGTAYASLLT